MVWGEVLKVAFGAIRANKLRSFLTMLGIIIGISAVIAMVALGNGAQRSVQERLSRLGTNVLTVRPGQQFMGGVDRGDKRLTVKDAEEVEKAMRYVKAVTPEMQRRFQVTTGNANAQLQALGVWPAYFSINNDTLLAGRIFTRDEERGRRRVVVLGGVKEGDEVALLSVAELQAKRLESQNQLRQRMGGGMPGVPGGGGGRGGPH